MACAYDHTHNEMEQMWNALHHWHQPTAKDLALITKPFQVTSPCIPWGKSNPLEDNAQHCECKKPDSQRHASHQKERRPSAPASALVLAVLFAFGMDGVVMIFCSCSSACHQQDSPAPGIQPASCLPMSIRQPAKGEQVLSHLRQIHRRQRRSYHVAKLWWLSTYVWDLLHNAASCVGPKR